MKKITLPILVITIFCTTLIQAQTYKVDIGVVRQEQDEWCWCACTKAILDYYGTTKQQCSITEYVRTQLPGTFGSTNCCQSPTGKCNSPNNLSGTGSVQDALMALGQVESAELGALSEAQVETEMKGQRPFVVAIYWKQGGGHAVTMCAYNKTAHSFTYMDPWQNNGMTTQQFSTSIQGGVGTWEGSLTITTPHNSGINNLNTFSGAVTLYPNPSRGQLTVSTALTVSVINVFNTLGQLVTSYPNVTEKSVVLKLPGAGFYNVEVVTDKGIINKKVIVQ